ncbi:MAG: hypothetical protein IPG96_20760 [Proteobacteria bacterium]|nr:hypothetical protein [Pseudomonadota bacterium]
MTTTVIGQTMSDTKRLRLHATLRTIDASPWLLMNTVHRTVTLARPRTSVNDHASEEHSPRAA